MGLIIKKRYFPSSCRDYMLKQINFMKKSWRSIVTLGPNRVVIRRRHAPPHVLPLKRRLHLRYPFALPSLAHIVGGLRFDLDLTLKVGLQTLKSYHHHRYIVQSFLIECQFHDIFHRLPAELMQRMKRSFISFESVPHNLNNLRVAQLIVYSVAWLY